jgi:hypothetical protein
MLIIVVLAAAVTLQAECGEREWRLESARCAQAAGMDPAWHYARGQVASISGRAGVKAPVFVRLGSSFGQAHAWAYLAHGGYGIAFDHRWLARASPTSIRVVAAHEVCHITEGQLDHIVGSREMELVNALESQEHLAVSACIIDQVGSDSYDAFLEREHGWDEATRSRHYQVVAKFRLRPRSRSR